jgi:hypothetical protein
VNAAPASMLLHNLLPERIENVSARPKDATRACAEPCYYSGHGCFDDLRRQKDGETPGFDAGEVKTMLAGVVCLG